MFRRPLFAALLSVIAQGCAAGSTPPPQPPVPTPSAFPAPPQQAAAWTAPPSPSLPAPLLTATEALFRGGLSDPRGCAYREIDLQVGDVWGRTETITTHGWVLPGATPAYAVAWNGLVYPIARAGAAANLSADVAAMIRRDEAARAQESADFPDSDFYRHRHGWSEHLSVASDSLLPLRAVLLLRLGEAALADRVWRTWHVGMRAGTNDDATHLTDPYLMLALDWTWALFDRSVNAHMRGDDRLARAGAELLGPIQAEVNRTAAARGFTTDGPDDLAFLEPLPALLADQQRRARGLPAPTDPLAQRIARLEDVAARQLSQPGGVALESDPRVQAVVADGAAAVDPLLAVLESDDRLTRAVSFHRDFARHRHLIGVHEAAYVALTQILGTETFIDSWSDLATPEGRRETAAAIRRFHHANRGRTPEDRWLAVLADDDASIEQWIEAATAITGMNDVTGAARGWGTGVTPGPRPPSPMPGEPLRARSSPSVTELLTLRLAQLNRDGSQVNDSTPYRVDVLQSCRLAVVLGHWDPQGAAGTLRAEIARAERMIDRMDALQDGFDVEYQALCIAQHTLALRRAGDPEALRRFTAWLRRVPIEKLGTNVQLVFEPIWTNAGDPDVRAFSRWAFSDPASPYIPLVRDDRESPAEDLLETPLVQVPIFRDHLLVELADRRRVAEARVISSGITVQGDHGWQISTGADDGDPFPRVGTIIPVRQCDVIAWRLTHIRAPADAPRVSFHWSEARRDQAIAALVEYLRRLPPP